MFPSYIYRRSYRQLNSFRNLALYERNSIEDFTISSILKVVLRRPIIYRKPMYYLFIIPLTLPLLIDTNLNIKKENVYIFICNFLFTMNIILSSNSNLEINSVMFFDVATQTDFYFCSPKDSCSCSINTIIYYQKWSSFH